MFAAERDWSAAERFYTDYERSNGPHVASLIDLIEADAALLDRMPRALGFDR